MKRLKIKDFNLKPMCDVHHEEYSFILEFELNHHMKYIIKVEWIDYLSIQLTCGFDDTVQPDDNCQLSLEGSEQLSMVRVLHCYTFSALYRAGIAYPSDNICKLISSSLVYIGTSKPMLRYLGLLD